MNQPETVERTEPDQGESRAEESEFLTPVGMRIRDELLSMTAMLRRNAVEEEQLSALAPETLEAIDRAGVFRLTLPLELGGYALGARDIAEIVDALGRGDGSAGWVVVTATATRHSLAFPAETVDEIFAEVESWTGPLMVGASLLSPVVGKARKVDGGWMISGKWTFASGCRHAAWATVGVEHQGPDGSPRRAMALLPREEFRILDDWKVMGLMGTSSDSITTLGEEAFVPEHRFFDMAEMPALMEQVAGRYEGLAYRFGMLGLMLLVPVSFGALALGMAEGTLECFVEQAKVRKPFNLPYPSVAEMASTQVTAGKARAMINVARTTIYSYADALDERALAGTDFAPADEPRITMDLIYAIRMCAEATDMLQAALGSSTVSLKNPIQRFVRDMRVLTTHGALRMDPMAEINGRQVFGLDPLPPAAGFGPPPPGADGAPPPPPPGAVFPPPPPGAAFPPPPPSAAP